MRDYWDKEVYLDVPVSCAGAEDVIEILVTLELVADLEENEVYLDGVRQDGAPVSPMNTLFSYAEDYVNDRQERLLSEAISNRHDSYADHIADRRASL